MMEDCLGPLVRCAMGDFLGSLERCELDIHLGLLKIWIVDSWA
jgi:hypothetical protein